MRAFVNRRYGAPDVMRLEELPPPELTDAGVLVRVHAASVNALDWHLLRGRPYLARLSEGIRRPKNHVRGVDLAGVVEAVGKEVTHLRVGDAVFGSRSGAFAEYVSGRNFVAMPTGLTFGQAAAIPTAGLTALQGLRDKGHLRAGQRVLILGAGGGVGTYAVQIAKALGAEVTAATRTSSLDLMHSLGADHVIDHSTTDLTTAAQRHDLVLDIAGTRSPRELRRLLTPHGTAVLVAPAAGNWAGPITHLVAAGATSLRSKQKIRPVLASVDVTDLQTLADLVVAGKLTSVIDRTFAFDEIPDAVRHLESGGVRGKVVVEIRPQPIAGATS